MLAWLRKKYTDWLFKLWLKRARKNPKAGIYIPPSDALAVKVKIIGGGGGGGGGESQASHGSSDKGEFGATIIIDEVYK